MRRRTFEVSMVLWLVAAIFLPRQAAAIDLERNLSLDLGVHYDLVGQRYRLTDDDTLDLFDERSLSLALGLGEAFNKGLWTENKLTLSDRSLRNLLAAGWNGAVAGKLELSVENGLEIKDYWWRGEDLFSSGYWENRFRIKGIWPFRPGLRVSVEQRLNYVDYQKSTTYFRDHWLSEMTAGLDLEMGLLWDLNLDYSFTNREVPDSSGMNYVSHSVMSSLDGLVGWTWQIGFDGWMERRRSADHDGRQDYTDLSGRMELEYELGSQLGIIFQGELERLAYDRPDEVYYNFWTTMGKLGLSRDFYEATTIALLPIYRRSKAQDTTIGETYRDGGVELELDYSGTGKLWLNFTLEAGSRKYETEEEQSFYSSYTYLHPTLFLNYSLTDKVSLNLLADHEPEWHQQKEDDFTSMLFSCSLVYKLQ